MSKFVLDTGAMNSALSSIQALSSEFESMISDVEGFDVECDDDFDFAGAKSVIVGNINACASKINNSCTVIERVIEAHDALQSGLKFESSSESNKSTGNSSSGGGYVGSSSSGGGYVGSSSSGGGYVGSSSVGSTAGTNLMPSSMVAGTTPQFGSEAVLEEYAGSLGLAGATQLGIVEVLDSVKWAAVQEVTTNYLTDHDSMKIAKRYGLPALPENAVETSEGLKIEGCKYVLKSLLVYSDEVVGLPARGAATVLMLKGQTHPKFWETGYSAESGNEHIYAGINQVNCKRSSELSVNQSLANKVEYNAEGYATIDNRYVISCDSYFGKVGDKVDIYTGNGVMECIIGDVPSNIKSEITFIANEKCRMENLSEKITISNIRSVNNLEYADKTPSITTTTVESTTPESTTPIESSPVESLTTDLDNSYEII